MFKKNNEPASLLPENPYFHRGPIKNHRYFYGRVTEIRQALQMLHHGQCVSIVGPRRIGKTSLLFHLCDSSVRQGLDLPQRCLFVYLDGQVLGYLDQMSFYQWMWTKLLEASESELGETIGDHYRAFLPKEVDCFEAFQKGVQTIVQHSSYIVFLFDEFEVIATNQNLDRASFAQLRSLGQEYNVAYVTASQMPLNEITYHDQSMLHSPFFNNFANLALSFLMPAEADEMVRGPVRQIGNGDFFTRSDLNFLYDVAGFHPFFLQIACYYLFERKVERKSPSVEDYEGVQRQYMQDVERHFQYIWKDLKKDEREAVRLTSVGKISQLPKSTRQKLQRKCVLYKDAFFSSAFARFVKDQIADSLFSDETKTTVQSKELWNESCHLDVTCTPQGQIYIRLSGVLSYQGGSTTPFDTGAVKRYARRVADARYLTKSWRFQVKEIGLELYREFFQNQPEVLTCYNRAKGKMPDTRLRISFSIPREFLCVPFEAIFAEDEMYLSLRHPLSRHILGHFTDKKILSSASIERVGQREVFPRALLVASNTWHSPVEKIPEVDVEVEQVSDLLRQHGFDVRTLFTEQASLQRVLDELENGNYCLFHYAGHGSYNADSPERSALYFWEGAVVQSQVLPLTAAQLESIVRNTPLLFAYLSCCWGAQVGQDQHLLDDDFIGIIDALVMGGVPAVLGFRWPVSDKGSQILAQSFYTALFEGGRELDTALLQARNRLDRDEQDWFSPVLIMQTLSP